MEPTIADTFTGQDGQSHTISYVYPNSNQGGIWLVDSDDYRKAIPGQEHLTQPRFAIKHDGTGWIEHTTIKMI
jgi:hypothetical protein